MPSDGDKGNKCTRRVEKWLAGVREWKRQGQESQSRQICSCVEGLSLVI